MVARAAACPRVRSSPSSSCSLQFTDQGMLSIALHRLLRHPLLLILGLFYPLLIHVLDLWTTSKGLCFSYLDLYLLIEFRRSTWTPVIVILSSCRIGLSKYIRRFFGICWKVFSSILFNITVKLQRHAGNFLQVRAQSFKCKR
jgi:hypothetical protein